MSSHSPTSPILIYLPPFSRPRHLSPPLPPFVYRFPTAVVNYRWSEDAAVDSDPAARSHHPHPPPSDDDLVPANPLNWPTPLHDVLFGYSWVTANLAPPGRQRRDIYVVGSYLGASLAASLALTESHKHEPAAIRGVALYNGIYDWTTFLPEQPRPIMDDAIAALKAAVAEPFAAADDSAMRYLARLVPSLFRTPADLFDPFASSTLFFRSTGLLPPASFSDPPSTQAPVLQRRAAAAAASISASDPRRPEPAYQPPRRGYLAFPPRQSSLRIPEALVLHETSSPSPAPARAPGRRATTKARAQRRHDFATQAEELVKLMRRSVDKYELRDRLLWDDEFVGYETEADRRVQLRAIGTGDEAEEALGPAVQQWLEEKMDACP